MVQFSRDEDIHNAHKQASPTLCFCVMLMLNDTAEGVYVTAKATLLLTSD